MNWATVAPETRIYKGKNLFRWDVSPGLEHHCGTCETPLHNSRAKTSCIGKHVEPCYRFHQQLHFIGRSHECFGCNHSDEMHHTRHKDILILVRKITVMDDLNLPSRVASDSPSQRKSRRGSTFTASTSTPTETSSDMTEETTKLKRSERKKAKKMGLDSSSTKRNVESFPKEDTDFISEAIHLSIHETKGGWEGTYVYVNKRNESDESIPEVEDEDLAGLITNLSVKPPSTPVDLTPRQRRCVKKFTNPAKHNNYRGGSRKFSPKPKGSVSDLFDGVDPEIFYRLGIEVVNPIKNSVVRKELIAKLVAAIKNDLNIIKQEDEETTMRQDGFLRWAGKAAYQAIMDTREGLDWATGQKIGNSHISKREPAQCEAAFVDPEDADIQEFMDAMNKSGQTTRAIASDDPPIIKEKLDFAVKAPVVRSTKEKVEDNDHGWETPPGKKVVRKRRTEGGKVFRSEVKDGGMPTIRISLD